MSHGLGRLFTKLGVGGEGRAGTFCVFTRTFSARGSYDRPHKLGFHQPTPKACRIQENSVPLPAKSYNHAIASAADGNRPQQQRSTNNTLWHKPFAYLYIHWRAMPLPCCGVALPSASEADICAPAHDRLAVNKTYSRTRPEESCCEAKNSAVRRREPFLRYAAESKLFCILVVIPDGAAAGGWVYGPVLVHAAVGNAIQKVTVDGVRRRRDRCH